jgi:hypothetical protein
MVIINETMARWPNESPLGKRIDDADASVKLDGIVGVVADVRIPGELNATGTADVSPLAKTPTFADAGARQRRHQSVATARARWRDRSTARLSDRIRAANHRR